MYIDAYICNHTNAINTFVSLIELSITRQLSFWAPVCHHSNANELTTTPSKSF